jgi:AcrR family transcriptional regulator
MGERENIDGRVMRGARNRAFIMDAIFELVQEGELIPTAEQVAQRAGVGTRTVFRHFDDMESLYAEMQARLEREVRPLIDGPPIEGDFDERLKAILARRARIFERIAPFRRSGSSQRFRSTLLEQGPIEFDRVMRKQLCDVFALELKRLPDDCTEALDMVASFEAWDRLRSAQRLGRERAQRVVEEAVRGVLGHPS